MSRIKPKESPTPPAPKMATKAKPSTKKTTKKSAAKKPLLGPTDE